MNGHGDIVRFTMWIDLDFFFHFFVTTYLVGRKFFFVLRFFRSQRALVIEYKVYAYLLMRYLENSGRFTNRDLIVKRKMYASRSAASFPQVHPKMLTTFYEITTSYEYLWMQLFLLISVTLSKHYFVTFTLLLDVF